MPRWDAGELPDAPQLTLRSWALLIGPGLVAAGAAIGGGEWLAGPLTTARYGGAILWLATLSILVAGLLQPRNLPLHALLRRADFHRQVSPAARARVLARRLPVSRFRLGLSLSRRQRRHAAGAVDPRRNSRRRQNRTTCSASTCTGKVFLRCLTYVVFLMALMPLIFGGKVYNSLKAIMTFQDRRRVRLSVARRRLLFLDAETWIDILTGFFKFGSVPVHWSRRRCRAANRQHFRRLVAWHAAADVRSRA